MLLIPSEITADCSNPGTISSLSYGDKYVLLYTPTKPAQHILYLIHGGGGDQHYLSDLGCGGAVPGWAGAVRRGAAGPGTEKGTLRRMLRCMWDG